VGGVLAVGIVRQAAIDLRYGAGGRCDVPIEAM